MGIVYEVIEVFLAVFSMILSVWGITMYVKKKAEEYLEKDMEIYKELMEYHPAYRRV